jgi:hypothetical protein
MRVSVILALLVGVCASAADVAPPPRPLAKFAYPSPEWSKAGGDEIPVPMLMPMAPPPREEGQVGMEPERMAGSSGIRREAIQGWVNNLGSSSYSERETAEINLRCAGYDGYVAARAVAAQSECPESRARACRICSSYLTVFSSNKSTPYPKIYTLACRLNGEAHLYEPPDQYFRALLCYYYTMKAIRVSWDARRRHSDDFVGDMPAWDYSATNYESAATQLFVHDLLVAGYSREWVTWMLDEMSLHKNYWPPALQKPPLWLGAFVGVRVEPPFNQ